MNATEQQLRRSDEYRAAGYWGDDTFVTLIDKWADADPNHPYVSDGIGPLVDQRDEGVVPPVSGRTILIRSAQLLFCSVHGGLLA